VASAGAVTACVPQWFGDEFSSPARPAAGCASRKPLKSLKCFRLAASALFRMDSLSGLASTLSDALSGVELPTNFEDSNTNGLAFRHQRKPRTVSSAQPAAPGLASSAYAHLEITRIDADNILAADDNGLSDPYFVFRIVRSAHASPPPPTDNEAAAQPRKTTVINEQRTDLHWDAPGFEFELKQQDGAFVMQVI
jgi:hypothetical protein